MRPANKFMRKFFKKWPDQPSELPTTDLEDAIRDVSSKCEICFQNRKTPVGRTQTVPECNAEVNGDFDEPTEDYDEYVTADESDDMPNEPGLIPEQSVNISLENNISATAKESLSKVNSIIEHMLPGHFRIEGKVLYERTKSCTANYHINKSRNVMFSPASKQENVYNETFYGSCDSIYDSSMKHELWNIDKHT